MVLVPVGPYFHKMFLSIRYKWFFYRAHTAPNSSKSPTEFSLASLRNLTDNGIAPSDWKLCLCHSVFQFEFCLRVQQSYFGIRQGVLYKIFQIWFSFFAVKSYSGYLPTFILFCFWMVVSFDEFFQNVSMQQSNVWYGSLKRLRLGGSRWS